VTVGGVVDSRRLVFVDEMATNTSLCAHYAYAPKGRRAYDAQVPRNRGANTTLHHAAWEHEPGGHGTLLGGRRHH
jgi:hypothetical protein